MNDEIISMKYGQVKFAGVILQEAKISTELACYSTASSLCVVAVLATLLAGSYKHFNK